MVNPTVEQLISGIALQNIPALSTDQLIQNVLSSSVPAVHKLTAICAIDRTMLRTIYHHLFTVVRAASNENVVEMIANDSLVLKSGRFGDAEKLTVTNAVTAIRVIREYVQAGNTYYQFILGVVSPTIADMFEAIGKVYEQNYTSRQAFTAFMTARTDSLLSLSFILDTMAYATVLNIRETQRKADEEAANAQQPTVPDTGNSNGSSTGSGTTGTDTGSTTPETGGATSSNGSTTGTDTSTALPDASSTTPAVPDASGSTPTDSTSGSAPTDSSTPDVTETPKDDSTAADTTNDGH